MALTLNLANARLCYFSSIGNGCSCGFLEDNIMNQAAYAAYIGIDWADGKHDIYLYDCTTGKVQESHY